MLEPEFKEAITQALEPYRNQGYNFVTGPGRSGAIAAVYASYILKIPFVPHKANKRGFWVGNMPVTKILVVDTAEYTGYTIRKAVSYYRRLGNVCDSVTVFKEEKHNFSYFWYEV